VAWLLGIGLPVVGALFLFTIGNRTKSFVSYQIITLLGAVVISAVALATSPNSSIYKLGDLTAPADNIIGASYGAFTLIAFAVTTLVVYLQVVRGKEIDKSLLIRFALIALPLSAMNALTEELIFRAAIMQSMIHVAGPATVVVLSGLLFGIPHYFGNPGKLPGVVMATFLGVIAAQSIFDTGGLGWAWIMHFVQDVPIITMLLLTGAKKL
jgi:membrane protease YdiL (CAAX protease family)